MKITTPKELVALLNDLNASEKEKTDTTNLKYVIYARKSRDETDKQANSIPDQIYECQSLASKEGLLVVTTISEAISAREPDIRPRFRKLLDDIIFGKYDGIISWHPDRLARNMKEAGEIIDLLDKGIIKDLKFKTTSYENTATGKMMLGINFVLAKEYSDRLGANVKRGVTHSVMDGKWLRHRPKYGYYKDRNQLLRPDNDKKNDNFNLIQTAWDMRIQGTSLQTITNFLNKNNLAILIDYRDAECNRKQKREPCIMTFQKVSKMFADPFYAGVMKYGDQVVDLKDTYDFVQMVTVPEFLQINKLNDITKAFKSNSRAYDDGAIRADLMRGKVFCGYCGEATTSQIYRKYKDKKKQSYSEYYGFRCDTQDCKFRGKSTRARVIIEFAAQELRKHNFATKQMYDRYVDDIKKSVTDRKSSLDRELRSYTQAEVKIRKKYENTKNFIADPDEDPAVKKMFSDDVLKYDDELKKIQKYIVVIKNEIKNQGSAVLSFEKFIELIKQIPDELLQTPQLKDKDFILQKIYLNFTVKDKKVVSYQFNQPFADMAKLASFSSSRDGGN